MAISRRKHFVTAEIQKESSEAHMELTQELGDQLYREEVLASRAMTPEQRVLAGARLFGFACKIAADGIRAQYPEASEEEVGRRLVERLKLQRRLEQSG